MANLGAKRQVAQCDAVRRKSRRAADVPLRMGQSAPGLSRGCGTVISRGEREAWRDRVPAIRVDAALRYGRYNYNGR
jgi:hypothetical protein